MTGHSFTPQFAMFPLSLLTILLLSFIAASYQNLPTKCLSDQVTMLDSADDFLFRVRSFSFSQPKSTPF